MVRAFGSKQPLADDHLHCRILLSIQPLAGASEMASSSADKYLNLDPEVGQSLLANSRSKAAAARTLHLLARKGLLKDAPDHCDEASIKRQLSKISADLGKVRTPYGPLIQSMPIGAPGLKHWEYISPCAILWYLCSLSQAFTSIMRSSSVSTGSPLRLIIFADSMTPGNPYRKDKGRSSTCIYWSFADWPAWLIARSFAWPVFLFCETASSMQSRVASAMS